MKVYQLSDPQSLRLRAHPWIDAEGDSRHRYYDLRRHPERIRTHLEDLLPWREKAAIETFFTLLERLNGPESALESNDCAFSGPSDNLGAHSSLRLEVSGRVMVLFRDLARNTVGDQVETLTQQVGYALSQADPSLEEAIVGVSVVDVQFTELPGPATAQRGQQLMLSFWAWGNDDAEAFANLNRVLASLDGALCGVS